MDWQQVPPWSELPFRQVKWQAIGAAIRRRPSGTMRGIAAREAADQKRSMSTCSTVSFALALALLTTS